MLDIPPRMSGRWSIIVLNVSGFRTLFWALDIDIPVDV